MFTFAYPWLFLLLPLPWLLRAVLPPRVRPTSAIRVPFGDRLSQVVDGSGESRPAFRSPWNSIFQAILWLLVLAALARPQWIESPVTRDLPTRDLLLLVDLSGSMNQEDFQDKSGETVDRLTAVKGVLGEFLERREGDRVGLVVFGDAPYLQAPFSTDLDLSRQLLDECEVGMAGPRTAFGDAIGLGVALFNESDAPARTMIALTDGNDTKSEVPPVEAARVAGQRNIRVYTVAIGDPTTVGEDKLDEEALRDVASATGGEYYFAADRDRLEAIYDELDRIETRKVETVSHRPRVEWFYWPLAIGWLLSLARRATEAWSRKPVTSVLKATEFVHVDPITGRLEVRE